MPQQDGNKQEIVSSNCRTEKYAQEVMEAQENKIIKARRKYHFSRDVVCGELFCHPCGVIRVSQRTAQAESNTAYDVEERAKLEPRLAAPAHPQMPIKLQRKHGAAEPC